MAESRSSVIADNDVPGPSTGSEPINVKTPDEALELHLEHFRNCNELSENEKSELCTFVEYRHKLRQKAESLLSRDVPSLSSGYHRECVQLLSKIAEKVDKIESMLTNKYGISAGDLDNESDDGDRLSPTRMKRMLEELNDEFGADKLISKGIPWNNQRELAIEEPEFTSNTEKTELDALLKKIRGEVAKEPDVGLDLDTEEIEKDEDGQEEDESDGASSPSPLVGEGELDFNVAEFVRKAVEEYLMSESAEENVPAENFPNKEETQTLLGDVLQLLKEDLNEYDEEQSSEQEDPNLQEVDITVLESNVSQSAAAGKHLANRDENLNIVCDNPGPVDPRCDVTRKRTNDGLESHEPKKKLELNCDSAEISLPRYSPPCRTGSTEKPPPIVITIEDDDDDDQDIIIIN